MSAEDPQSASSTSALSTNRPLLIVGAIAVVAILAACGLGSFLLGSRLQDGDGNATAQATSDGSGISEESAGVPTPFPVEPGGSGSGSQPVVVGVSDSGTFSVTMDIPATLSVLDTGFTVESESIGADGLWSPPTTDETTALWVNGSVVNYVFGLSDTESNRSLIESLAPGDTIALTTRQGVTHEFSFDSRTEVSTSDREVFSQQTPGVSLILIGGQDDTRLIARGRYEVASAAETTSGNVVQLGETAQLGELQVTPLATSYLADRPEAPAGFAFYLVDFSLQNVGLTAIDTANYRFVLSDELGNQYAANPIASRLGNNPALSGFLNAGQSVAATVGYQVPTGLVSPTLTWTVTNVQDGAQIQAILPFTSGAQTSQNVQVSIADVVITSDLSNLIIAGQITNVSDQPLVVVREDITLRTVAGSDFLLLATNPAFPGPSHRTRRYSLSLPSNGRS
ncbi:MAG: DUF4352 domain-containing protein [Chloroflexota bacterium]